MRGAAGACSRASTASTTTRSRAADLGWRPKWDFAAIVERLRETGDIRGPLAKLIGAKGYHAERFEGAPYPVAGS